MKRTTLSLAVGTLLAAAAPVMAQNSNPCSATDASTGCTVNVATSVTVPLIMQLNLSSTTTALSSPTAADYTAGFKTDAGPIATVTSNNPWKVVVNSSPTFSGPYAKPAGDLTWGTVAGTYSNAMGTAATMFSGTTGTASSSQGIFYRTAYSYANDVPGTYNLTVTFTLSAP